MPPSPPPLSPFIDDLRAAVRGAVRALIGAPDSVVLGSPGPRGPHRWGIELRAPGRPALEVTFSRPEPGGAPSVDGARADQPGSLALADPIGRRLRAHHRQRSPQWEALDAGWRALEPFLDLEDSHFRWVGPSSEGQRGMLRLGFRCNQDCGFCWQDRAWPEPPPERFFGWVDELAARGLDHLFISGGEPTTWKRLPELIRRASLHHGMKVLLQTNAVALANERVLRRLLDAGLAVASISLHAADPELSDALTAAPGTFARTVAGIRACRAAGLPVHLTCVVERRNLPGLPAHAQAIVDRFVLPFPDQPPPTVAYAHPCRSIKPEDFASSCPPLDQVRGPLGRATRILVEAGVPVTSVGGCGFPACALHDAPELLARLRPEDLRADDAASRRFGDACQGCAMKVACVGLRREYLEVHGEAGVEPFERLPPLPTTDPQRPPTGRG